MISILLPSRGRPHSIPRLMRSLEETTRGPYEVIVRLDSDDDSEYPTFPKLAYIDDDRATLSGLWNDCYLNANGDIFMQCGDDIVFRTEGWDELVSAAFPEDGITFVHGDDLGGKGERLGTHGFLRREWTDAVGCFTPDHFAADYTDLWLNEVADAIGRRVFLPDVITEHLHPGFEKAPWDQTYQETHERMQAGGIPALYESLAPERDEWAEKLRAVMR